MNPPGFCVSIQADILTSSHTHSNLWPLKTGELGMCKDEHDVFSCFRELNHHNKIYTAK